MSDIYRINISTLKSYEKDFKEELDNFKNKSYNTFSSSYLRNSSDRYLLSMSGKLQLLYEEIKTGYQNIDKWWTNYNENISGLENYLAGSGSIGAILEANIRNSASKLPILKKYDLKFAGIVPATLIKKNYNTTFTNNAVTASGFEETIAKVGSWVANANQNIGNWMGEVGAFISDGFDSLCAGIGNWWDDVVDWWSTDAAPAIERATNTVWSAVKSVGANVAILTQSLGEGILQFGEGIVDLAAIIGTGGASVVTGLIDGGQAIYGAITGNEWSSITKNMWEGTMGFVSNQYVTSWFDALYQDTAYGRWLMDNGFEMTRSIGSGIGYISGVVILTIATAGVGSVVASGGAVSASSAAAATTATQMAVTAGAVGIGKGTERAWKDGADLIEGLGAGTLNGVWEGLQFYIGGKISGLKMFGADGVLKNIGASELKTKVLNSLSRVVLDGADGGVEGFVIPLISSTYKDGYYDEDGNYIEFLDNQNIFERYNKIFDDNGGWSAVLTNAAVGSATSLLGEGLNLRKNFQDSQTTSNMNISNQELQAKINRYNELANLKNSQDYLSYTDTAKAQIEKEFMESKQDIMLIAGITTQTIDNISNISGGNPKIPSQYMAFSKEFKKSIDQMATYYGDAGHNIQSKFFEGKNIQQILTELKGQDKIDFQNFLQNTREGRYLASLSDTELRAMTTYTGGAYRKINDMLRKDTISGTIEGINAQSLINDMDNAIAKFGGLDEATEVYRAVDVGAFEKQQQYAALFKGIDQTNLKQVYSVLKVLEGKEFGDFGYMSASPGYSTSFAKYTTCPIVLDIIADKGTKGAYINQISDYYNMENEFLLARKTSLEIIEVLAPEIDINGLEKIVVKCVVK